MRLYKRGRTWWFSLEFEGKRHQKSTKEKNRVKAEGIAAGYRTKLAEGRVDIFERKPVPSMNEAMTSFLKWSEQEHQEHPATYNRYATSSKPLLTFLKFKGKPIDQITPAMVEDYKTSRSRQIGKHTKRPIMPATVNRELACLKAAFNYVLKDRHDFWNPVSDVEYLPENNMQNRVLSYNEQLRYLAAANDTLRDVATLMLETGMRPEEVYRITVGNIHLDHGYVFNPHGKTKAAKRNVPLNSIAAAILRRRVGTAAGAYVFPHKKSLNRPMLKANNAHTAALKESKVKKFRLYDLRHTWATRAAEGGMDIATLASLLGHSKLIMVDRYVHPGETHRMEAVRKLEEVNAARQARELSAATFSATVDRNPGGFEESENEGRSNQIN